MSQRLLGLAKAAFIWLGLAVMVGIAVVASANLALRLFQALRSLRDPGAILGLVGVAGASVVAVIVLAGAWRFASRGGRDLRIAVGGGFLLLVAVRLTIGVLVDAGLAGEKAQFDALARGILAGTCCFSDHPPGYPIVLAAAYAIFGPTATAGELLNLLLGVIGAAVLFALLRAHAGDRAAVLGLYLFAMWPAGALLSNARLSETLYIALLLLAALTAPRAPRALLAAITGVLLAVGDYVRPTTIALLPAFGLAMLWPGMTLRRALLATLLPLVVIFFVVLIPVTAYNLQVHGQLTVTTSAYGGWSLYIGTDERTGGRYSDQAQQEIDALTPGSAWDDSNAAGAVAVARIVHDPLLVPRLFPVKFNTLWGSEDYGVFYGLSGGALDHPIGTFPTVATGLFYVLITIGAAVTIFLRRHEIDALTALTIGLVLTVTLVHAFVEVRDRYHAYVTPFLIAIVAVALARWLAARRPETAASPVAAPA